MHKYLILLFSLLLICFAGCGGDDDGGGGGGTTTPTITVNSTAGSPDYTDPNDAVWNSVTAVSVDVSGANTPKVSGRTASSIPTSVAVKMVESNDSLFVQLSWTDPDNDIWPDYFEIDDADPPIGFSYPGQIVYEDQVFVMFDGGETFGWDVWNWRSFTTDAGGLAEGMKYTNSIMTTDAGGAAVATRNNNIFDEPTYIHRDTSEFSNNRFMYLEDVIQLNSEIWAGTDSAKPARNTTGWVLGQRVPGYIIDSALNNDDSINESRRASRFDIRASSVYSAGAYTIVLAAKLNTGQTDDLNLSTLSTVKMKIGIFDGQEEFSQGSSNRGFTPEITVNF